MNTMTQDLFRQDAYLTECTATVTAVTGQGLVLDRFEQEKESFFARVSQGFAEQAQRHPGRVVRLDASQTAAQVAAQALAVLDQRRLNPPS